MSAVQTYGERRHKAIAAAVGTRTAAQVRTFLTKRKAKGGLPAAAVPPGVIIPPAPAPEAGSGGGDRVGVEGFSGECANAIVWKCCEFYHCHCCERYKCRSIIYEHDIILIFK